MRRCAGHPGGRRTGQGIAARRLGRDRRPSRPRRPAHPGGRAGHGGRAGSGRWGCCSAPIRTRPSRGRPRRIDSYSSSKRTAGRWEGKHPHVRYTFEVVSQEAVEAELHQEAGLFGPSLRRVPGTPRRRTPSGANWTSTTPKRSPQKKRGSAYYCLTNCPRTRGSRHPRGTAFVGPEISDPRRGRGVRDGGRPAQDRHDRPEEVPIAE